jgi:DDE family transposase
MRKASPVRVGKTKRSANDKRCAPTIPKGGFLSSLRQIVSDADLLKACSVRTTLRGRPAKLDRPTFLRAFLFHWMNSAGTFGQHLLSLTGVAMSEGGLSERRRALPWEVFTRLMGAALKPRATIRKSPECFLRRWRVMAVDGTQFSLVNTAKNVANGKVRSSRGGLTGFAKLGVAVLLEIGLHNPVAAAVGRPGQSEWSLALSLLSHLPKDALLLADRLYGCGYFAYAVMQHGRHFLFRVREQFEAKVVRTLKDGSQLVEVPVRDRKVPKKIIQALRLRQIRVQLQRKGFRPKRLRLWTNLLDEREAPARELAQLYNQRWEEEHYFRQLKHDLRKGDLLQSQTPETAAQEVAAMIVCSALVAQYRAQAATGEIPALRISFSLTLEMLRPLWLVLAVGEDLLGRNGQEVLVSRILDYLAQTALKPRRRRTCLRGVRQRRKGWPKIKKPISNTAETTYKVLRSSKS